MDLRWILRRLLEGERYNFLAESYHQRRHQRLMIESVDGQFIKCLWFKICAFKMGSINDISSLIGAIKSCFVIPFGKVNDIWTDEQANLWTLDSLQSTPSYSEPVEAIYEEETLSEKSHALKAWLFVFFCAFACCCTNGTCIKKQNSLSASFCARAMAVPTTQKNCRLYEPAGSEWKAKWLQRVYVRNRSSWRWQSKKDRGLRWVSTVWALVSCPLLKRFFALFVLFQTTEE